MFFLTVVPIWIFVLVIGVGKIYYIVGNILCDRTLGNVCA
jgi:hypothetical protein